MPTALTIWANMSFVLNMFFVFWFLILKGLLFPFTVVIIKNRRKDANKLIRKDGKKEIPVSAEQLEKELNQAKEIAKTMAEEKSKGGLLANLKTDFVQLDNYEIIVTKARVKFKNGIKGFVFLRNKGFAQVSANMKLYPVRNIMKQEVAAILYTEDELNYQWVGIRKEGNLTTLPEDLKAWAIESLKQNAKKWDLHPTLQLIFNAMPIITLVGCGIAAFIFMKQMLPDMIAQAAQASANHIEAISSAIKESGIKCVCEC